jgi:hypothetical protein
MSLGDSREYAVDTWKMLAFRFRQNKGCERSNVGGVVRVLDTQGFGRDIVRIGKTGPCILSVHHMVGRIQHRFLQMNRDFTTRDVDCSVTTDCLDRQAEFQAVMVGHSNILQLEQFLNGWEVRLDAAKTPEFLSLFLKSLEIGTLLNIQMDIGCS